MRFEVLGHVRVLRDGEDLAISGLRRLQLLGLLLAHPKATLSPEWLADALWGDDGTRAGPRLHVLVHKVRQLLGEADRLRLEAGGYRLDVGPDEVDAQQFEAIVGRASGTDDPDRRVDLLRSGLAIWRGPAYDGLDLPQLSGEIQRLDERRLDAMEELFRAELARGRHREIVAELTELTRRHPLRESLYVLLMTALHQAGRRADALAVYRAARRGLVDELGVEPGAELRRVERQVLAGEEPASPETRATPSRRPAQLPPVVPDFVGRGAELADLDQLEHRDDLDHRDDDPTPRTRVAVVAGTAGVGKTTLAVRWAHRSRERFPDGQLYVDLRGYGPDRPLSAAEVLSGFLRALGVHPSALPEEVTELAARFRTETDGARLLLVLDNAATVDQVRPLLPGSDSCFVLVTSRDRLPGLVTMAGAHRIDLDRLTTGEARSLLRRVCAPADERNTDLVVERCARLPLAIRIVADLLRSGEGAEDVLRQLDDERQRLDLLDTGDAHSSIRSVLSWSYQQLGPDAARLFRCFGLRPGPDIDVHGLAALLGDRDLRATRRLLTTLTRAHLVEPVSTARYHQHDLLWAFASELAAEYEPEQERAAAVQRLRELYRYGAWTAADTLYPGGTNDRRRYDPPATPVPNLTSAAEAASWLDAEYANLLAAVDLGGEDRLAYTADLSAVLARHLRRRGLHADARSLHTRGLEAAKSCGNAVNEQAALFGLGHVSRLTSHFDEATDYFRTALQLARDIGYRYGEISALGGLADNLLLTGNQPEAAVRYQEVLELSRASGFRLGEVKALAGLGHSANRVRRSLEARENFRASLEHARELGHRSSELTATAGLGDAARDLGDLAGAGELYRQTLEGCRAFGHRVGAALMLERLGDLELLAGRPDAAQRLQREALSIARDVGNRGHEALIRIRLARVARANTDYGAAAEHLAAARRIADHIGVRWVRFEVLHGLGRLGSVSGDPVAAVRHHHAALGLADRPLDQARSHEALAEAYLARGETDTARHHSERARELDALVDLPEAASSELDR